MVGIDMIQKFMFAVVLKVYTSLIDENSIYI